MDNNLSLLENTSETYSFWLLKHPWEFYCVEDMHLSPWSFWISLIILFLRWNWFNIKEVRVGRRKKGAESNKGRRAENFDKKEMRVKISGEMGNVFVMLYMLCSRKRANGKGGNLGAQSPCPLPPLTPHHNLNQCFLMMSLLFAYQNQWEKNLPLNPAKTLLIILIK